MESCNPSFSATATMVMASVDTRAGAPSTPTPIPWPWQELDSTRDEEAVDEQGEEWPWTFLLRRGPSFYASTRMAATESCDSSFSATATTAEASVDTRAGDRKSVV